MNEHTGRPNRLITDINNTSDFEIYCSQVGILIARCAQALLTDEESQRQYPEMWQHFHFCADCAEEYRMVMDFARMEQSEPLAAIGRIPSRPDAGSPFIWRRAKDAILELFPGFSPAFGAALTRSGTSSELDLAAPVEVALGERQELRIEFDLAANEQDRRLRDLFCILWTDDDELRGALEAAPVWLKAGDQGPAIREGAWDDLGEVSFSAIQPGEYSLHLQLAGQEYDVLGIRIP